MTHYEEIRRLIGDVRRRWRTLQALDAAARGSFAAVVVIGAALVATLWTNGAPLLLTAIVLVALAFTAAVLVWALLPLRRVPSDRQIARFIEERTPDLEDR
ncbi:MAG TPA: hypothetical protein VI258_14205, partial [Rhodanobacteraceae bacterium]